MLPRLDREVVREMYQNHAAELDLEECSGSYFYRCWREDPIASRIRIRKWLRFMECDCCVEFSHRRSLGLESEDAMRLLVLEEREHWDFIKLERKSYYVRCERAVKEKHKYLSLVIDGADQSRFHLPHFRRKSHETAGGAKIGLHLMGCLAHGRASYAFTVLPHVKQGANATIHVLHRVLLDTYRREGRLPDVLYLQLDNTTKQCKNKYVMAWCGLLVTWGVFREVLVSFLPVGHTHEDIDQFFSRTSVALLKNDALSRLQVGKVVKGAYKFRGSGEAPVVEHLDTLANISGWLDPLVSSLDGITQYYQMKIMASTDHSGRQAPCIQFKERSSHAVEVYDLDFAGLTKYSRAEVLVNEKGRAMLEEIPFSDKFPVPPHQRHQHVRYRVDPKDKEGKDYAKAAKTIPLLLASARGLAEGDADYDDVVECLRLMDPETPCASFDWDVSIYRSHARAGRQMEPAAAAAGVAEPGPEVKFPKKSVVFVAGDLEDALEPHYLAKVVGHGRLEDGSAALKVKYWTLHPDTNLAGRHERGKRLYHRGVGEEELVSLARVVTGEDGNTPHRLDKLFNKTAAQGSPGGFALSKKVLMALKWVDNAMELQRQRTAEKAAGRKRAGEHQAKDGDKGPVRAKGSQTKQKKKKKKKKKRKG